MNIIAFINHVGQTIIGEEVKNTTSSLEVKNPALLLVQPNNTGQLQVQLIPLFFKEFLDEKKRQDGIVFTFNKSNIVPSNASLDARLTGQYTQIFSAAKPINESKGDAPVIKLFDE